MKLAYVANIRIPTEKAHGYQIMRVCSQWASEGHDVTLFVPKRSNHITQDAFTFYGIEKNFTLAYVPCYNWMRLVGVVGRAAFFAHSLAFLWALQSKLPKEAVIYTRDAEAVWYLSRRGWQCVFNAHNWPRKSWLAAKFISRAKGVVCNSHGTETVVAAATHVPTVVAYNASDPNLFVDADKRALREELSLPVDKKIVLYSGHLYGWKGADILLQCARVCEQYQDLLFVCVGGTVEDTARLQEQTGSMGNIRLLGHQPKALVPKYLAAADLLLLPNTKATRESVRFTSPLKMFEYIASGTPIVASDLPSLREILTDETAYFCEPGSAESLAETVIQALENSEEAAAKATQALALSKRYSWPEHSKITVAFIERVTR